MKKNNLQQRYFEQKIIKKFLFYNDLYQIFCYLRQPFLRLGNKTAQQIISLPIFLSFFVLFGSILQISFDTRNSSILKNYPLLTNLSDPQIPQTFETFAFKVSNNKKEQFLQYQKDIEKAKLEISQQQSEEQKRFIDFFKYLNYKEFDFPSIFENIPIPTQQQNAINLYKTFEQLGPLLFTELQKEEEQDDPQYQQAAKNTIIHLSAHIPYHVWSSKTKDFDAETDHLLTNGQFDKSEIVIKDLKKDNNLDLAYTTVKDFINNYKDFIEQNEEKIFIKHKIFPFQNVTIAQNLKKIFIKSTNPIVNSWDEMLSVFMIQPSNNFTDLFDENTFFFSDIANKKTDKIVSGIIPAPEGHEIPTPFTSHFQESLIYEFEKPMDLNSELEAFIKMKSFPKEMSQPAKKECLGQPDGPEGNAPEGPEGNNISASQKSQKRPGGALPETKFEKYLKSEDLNDSLPKPSRPMSEEEKYLHTMVQNIQSKLLSGRELEYEKIKQSLNKGKVKRKIVPIHKRTGLTKIPKHSSLEIKEILREALHVQNKIQPKFPTTPREYYNRYIEEYNKKLNEKFPAKPSEYSIPKTFEETLEAFEETFYQVEQIEDLIPLKLQGVYPNTVEKQKSSVLNIDKYEEPEYEILCYEKEAWDNFEQQLSTLVVKNPPLMEVYHQHIEDEKKQSLHKLKLNTQQLFEREENNEQTIKSEDFHETFMKFLEVIQTKIPYYNEVFNYFQKIEKMPMRGSLDLEIREFEKEHKPQKPHKPYRRYRMRLLKPKNYIYETYKEYQTAVRRHYRKVVSEKVIFRPKPDFFCLNDYVYFYKKLTPYGEEYDILDLETHSDFTNWRQKQAIKNLDHYLKTFSYLLELQDKNPYLEKIILPEDYLLESILFFINTNWTALETQLENQLFQQKTKEMNELLDIDTLTESSDEDEEKEYLQFNSSESSEDENDENLEINLLEQDDQEDQADVNMKRNYSSDLFNENPPEGYQNLPLPTVVTSALLDFFKTRKIQRTSILKKYGPLLQLKNLLDEKKKIQTSFLYDYIFQHPFFEQGSVNNFEGFENFQVIPPNLLNKKYLLNSKRESLLPEGHGDLNNSFKTPILKNIKIFKKLYLLDIYKSNWKFKLLWFPKKFNLFKQKLFLSKFKCQILNKINYFLSSTDRTPLSQTNDFIEESLNNVARVSSYSFWQQNYKKLLAYRKIEQLRNLEFDDRIYFIRKLPQLPKNLDCPSIFLNSPQQAKKERYPFRITNTVTDEMREKVKRTQNILAIFAESYICNELKDFQTMEGLYDKFLNEMSLQSLRDFYSYDEKKQVSIFQKETFEKAIEDILEDFYNEYILVLNQKGLEQSIYQTELIRPMSGYIFPDMARKILLKIHTKKSYTIEIEIPLYDLNRNLFIELKNQNNETPALQTPVLSFKHQQKITKRSFFNNQFFEIRENFNRYSWSILLFFSSGWVFVNIFKNVYKKYAKEIVESCIDFLKRAGILDDVQWIKEELGMAPVDKGYRGIRHQGKKLKNIIGINRKHVIIEVSEMIWFLKTKKLLKSTALDPFVQLIILLQYHLTTLQIQQLTQRNKILIQTTSIQKPSTKLEFTEFLERIQNQEQCKLKNKPEGNAPRGHKDRLRPFQWSEKNSTSPDAIEKPDLSKLSLDNFKFLPLKVLNKRQNQQYLKPKGFLFTGPPGTGKTLLVQAIAGETGVPVVTQSGGLLQNPRLRGRGAKTLHKLFLRAREIAPCIIFIDEIDGIGTRRQFLPLNVDIHGRYDPVEWLESEGIQIPPQNIQPKLQRRPEFFDDHDPFWEEPEFTQRIQTTRIPIDVLQDMQSSRGARSEQLSILTQLLIELDGLHLLESIVVIGATNRLEILDPALMRPGRFQRILKFNLPDYLARINLLKLYTQASKIGIENISWDYFAKRTHGLSSADIASIVFASELTAVQQLKKHTFETLERGIDLITSFPTDPVIFRLKNIFIFISNSTQIFFEKNFFYHRTLAQRGQVSSRHSLLSKLFTVLDNRQPEGPQGNPAGPEGNISEMPRRGIQGQKINSLVKLKETSNVLRTCYYNIGKLIILFCLQILSFSSAYMTLWERPKNFRFFFFTKNFNEFDEFDKKMLSRQEIEKRLLAFFGGKAAESLFIFLPLNRFSSEIYFQFDSTFICLINSLEQSNFGMENEIQMAQSLLQLMIEKWYFYLERIATEKFHPILENVNLWEYVESEKDRLFGQAFAEEIEINLDMRNRLSKNEQKYSYQAWWMKKVATRLNYNEKSFLQWSRIYLSDPDNSAQNIEWVAPDEYFHTIPRTPPYCMSWTHFLENGRFALSNLLLLQAFNTVFKTLRQFSEFMDFLADHFLRYECLREKEFRSKIHQFFDYYLKHINEFEPTEE